MSCLWQTIPYKTAVLGNYACHCLDNCVNRNKTCFLSIILSGWWKSKDLKCFTGFAFLTFFERKEIDLVYGRKSFKFHRALNNLDFPL